MLGHVLLPRVTTGGHGDVRAAEVSLCFWGSGADLPAPSFCAFSKGWFQTGSLMHERSEGVPVPWLPLGPPDFLFQSNICSTVPRGHLSPSPPETPRGTCSKWRCPREGFPLVGLGTPAVKTPSGRTEERGRVLARRPHSCLQLDHSPRMQRSMALEVTSVLSAGAFSREGFPERLITGVMQSLQLSSAETFVAEIF